MFPPNPQKASPTANPLVAAALSAPPAPPAPSTPGATAQAAPAPGQAQASAKASANPIVASAPSGHGRQSINSMDPGQADGEAHAANTQIQMQPVITGLAAWTREKWSVLSDHKRGEVEERLTSCLMARNEEYPPDKLAKIRSMGSSEQYIGVVSEKCRAATAWLGDAVLGTGEEKPWSIRPTAMPQMSPEDEQAIKGTFESKLVELYADAADPVTGQITRLSEDELRIVLEHVRASHMRDKRELADMRVAVVEKMIEDRFQEGGLPRALHEFVSDVATYPFAVMKGPVARRRVVMGVQPDGLIGPTEVVRDEWTCVNPFKFYWAPWAESIQDGPVIEQHYLARQELEALMGTEGYNDDAIRAVLATMSTQSSGLVDTTRGGFTDAARNLDLSRASGEMAMAIQLWDTIPGRYLKDWGLEGGIDPHRSYACEVWMVHDTVIKAVLNPDPAGQKPYYVTSFEKQNQSVMGKGVADIVMFAQDMVNAAARNLSNNMALAAGPQVVVDVSKLVNGQNLSTMRPGMIWQRRAADFGGDGLGHKPIEFFQPNSNAEELMRVIEAWQSTADDKSGIPRYMAGAHQPGVTRTSTGLSMLMANAGRGLKQVLSNIDSDVLKPLVERAYRDLLAENPPELMDALGDVQIEARGATALMVKETEEVRKNEILTMIVTNDRLYNIVKDEGVAKLLAAQLKSLGAGAENIVPPHDEIVRERLAREAMLERQMAEQGAMGAPGLEAPQGQGQGQPGKPESGQPVPEQPGGVDKAGGYSAPDEHADGTPQGGRQSNTSSARPNAK